MEVKANVHKRRQDRIRELQARSAPGSPERTAAAGRTVPKLPDPIRELPVLVRRPVLYDHGGDPEAAWKEREKELLLEYSRPEADSHASPYDGQGPRGAYGSFGGNGPLRKLLMAKTIAAVLLFGGAWALFQVDHPMAQKGRQYVESALTEDMDFGTIAAWYDKTFSGAPSFLPAFGSKQEAAKVNLPVSVSRFVQPVKGKVTGAFTESKQGIWLVTKRDAHVAAMEEGRIEYAGDRADSGHTVIIQHAGGLRTTYGGLQPTKWEVGDWVKAGDVIGSAGTGESGQGSVFVAVMKDQRYVNPSEVIAFD